MGRRKINEEDKVEGLMLHIKGYIRDNINDDPDAMNAIYNFIENNWGEKNEEKYERVRREKRIELLERNLDSERFRLKDMRASYGESSDLYRMMSPAVKKKINEFEDELRGLLICEDKKVFIARRSN